VLKSIKKCCEKRGFEHCGECVAFSCKKIRDYSLIDGGKFIAEHAELREAGKRVDNLLTDRKYNYISQDQRNFVVALDKTLIDIGYESSGIVPYVGWKYKIEYSKSGLKNKRFDARFYFYDKGIILRLYFNDIDRHSKFIENAPDFIKEPFINERGKCNHCDKSGGGIGKKGKCTFKKTYSIDGVEYSKCAGENFYFENFDISNVPKYMELITSFYG